MIKNAKFFASFALIVDPYNSSRLVIFLYVARNSGGGRSNSDGSLTDFLASPPPPNPTRCLPYSSILPYKWNLGPCAATFPLCARWRIRLRRARRRARPRARPSRKAGVFLSCQSLGSAFLAQGRYNGGRLTSHKHTSSPLNTNGYIIPAAARRRTPRAGNNHAETRPALAPLLSSRCPRFAQRNIDPSPLCQLRPDCLG